jgi:hypothetical protein
LKKVLFLAVLVIVGWGTYRYMDKLGAEKLSGVDQVRQGQKMKETALKATGKAAVSAVKEAVERYRTEKGSWPGSLAELAEKGYLDAVPAGLSYDPATGEVKAAE